MPGYLSWNIICSLKLAVFLELRSWKTVRFLEQIMFAYKYPSLFLRQMEAILCLTDHTLIEKRGVEKSSLSRILSWHMAKNLTCLVCNCPTGNKEMKVSLNETKLNIYLQLLLITSYRAWNPLKRDWESDLKRNHRSRPLDVTVGA